MGRVLRGLLVAVLLLAAPACSGDHDKVPYHDARSTGSMVLYGRDGAVTTGGRITDRPFVARAVAQAKAPPPYDKAGRKATLLAYQPRQGIDPEQWDGTFLTGANTYPDPDHPTVVVPDEGLTLAQFLARYRAGWDGLVQLRIFLGAPGESTLNNAYATADLRITGDRWVLLRAGKG